VLKVEPLAILDRRITKRKNQVMVEVLVQWANVPSEDATWEKYNDLVRQFPDHSLEDKTNSEGRVMSEHKARSELVTVSEGFEQINQGKEMGLGYCNTIQVTGYGVGPREEKSRPSIRC
jgi:Chromo (CHRromatin Organisation MOdifier) domain